MKRSLFACLISLCTLASGTAWAAVDLSWNGCAPGSPDLQIEPYTATDHTLTVSIEGIEGDFNGLDFTIAIFDPCSAEGQFIPQAWRFDANGCQAGLVRIARPASYDGCPGLPAAVGTPTIESVTTQMLGGYLFPPDNSVITSPAVMVHFAQLFPTTHLSAGQRYVAARITFPMGETVAGADPEGIKCGCASAPRLLLVTQAEMSAPDGGATLPAGQPAYWVEWVGCAISPKGPPTTDAASDPACLTTPTRALSWGRIKAQYR